MKRMNRVGKELYNIMNNKEFRQAWEEMERLEPLTPSKDINVINPTGQRGLEECQDLDKSKVLQRLEFLDEEIRILENRIKPHDTGHIKTAISVLKHRYEEVDKRLNGHTDWFNEYL